MNSRGNEIWLGGDVDRGLLFLSTKGIWILVGRIRDPLSLRCSLMEERERIRCYDLELVNLPLRRRRGVFIVRGEKMTVWGESGVSGLIPGWTGNSTGNSLWGFWLKPRIEPKISDLNRAWDRDQTEPAQKHVWAWLSLSGPKFG
jgi:hypothetical protein